MTVVVLSDQRTGHGVDAEVVRPVVLAFAYLGCVSMFLGFFAWYRGLATGPMAQVSRVQLVQPVLSILWAALLLHERSGWATLVGGLAVVVCARSAVRTRLSTRSS